MTNFEDRMSAADPAANIPSTSPDVMAERIAQITGGRQPKRWVWFIVLLVVALVGVAVVRLAGDRPDAPVLASPSPTQATSSQTTVQPTPSPTPSQDAHEAAVALLQAAAANPPHPEVGEGQYLTVRTWGTSAGSPVGKGDPLTDGWITSQDVTVYYPGPGTPYLCSAQAQSPLMVGTYGSINTDGFPPADAPPITACVLAMGSDVVAPPTDEESMRQAVTLGFGVDSYLVPTMHADVRAAMLDFLAAWPTIAVVETGVDVFGVAGTAISVPEQPGVVQVSWIFDDSGTYLGARYEVAGETYQSAVAAEVLDRLPDQVVADACRLASERAGDQFSQSVCPEQG